MDGGIVVEVMDITNPDKPVFVDYYFQVQYEGFNGWVKATQLNFAPIKAPATVPTTTPGLHANPTPTLTPLPDRPVPYTSEMVAVIKPAKLLIRPVDNQPGSTVTFLYQDPNLESPVVGLVRAGSGHAILQINDVPVRDLVVRTGVAYHAGSWFKIQNGRDTGWIREDFIGGVR